MIPLRFVIQLASKDVAARLRVNRFVVASASGLSPAATAKHIGTYLVRGKNTFELEGTLLAPTGEGPRVLELALHGAGGDAPLSDATLMLAYSLTENEVPPGDGPHTLLSHSLGLGSDADRKHAWDDGREVAKEDAIAFAAEGLEVCRKALFAKEPAALAALVGLHTKDHAALLGIPEEEATLDIVGDAIQLTGAADRRVEIASVTDLAPEVLLSGRAVHVATKSGGPPIVVSAAKSKLGVYPTFSSIDGRPTLVRWS